MTMYASGNPKTKKQLKEQVAAGVEILVFSAGMGSPPVNGQCAVSGPHYPQPHKWYATCTIRDGKIVAVK